MEGGGRGREEGEGRGLLVPGGSERERNACWWTTGLRSRPPGVMDGAGERVLRTVVQTGLEREV